MPAKGIAHFGLLLSLSLCINPVHAVTVSDLLISEVMANPAALSDARGEWFELYNPITEVINLHEVTIGDDGSDRHKFESDLLVLPGEYLTLARYLDPGFTPDYVYDGFTLGNSGDEIVFSDCTQELLRLDYGSDFDAAGRSRELVELPMIAANYDLTMASLSYGPGDIGTPGAAGSTGLGLLPEPILAVVPIPATVWLFVSGLLALFSLTSARSSPTFQHSRSSFSACLGLPDTSDRRGSGDLTIPLFQPVSATATSTS
jgi:hypothetical protein